MAPPWKPFLNRLRKILRPVETELGELIARGRILVNSETGSIAQCELVLRLLDRMSSEGEDPTLLATAKAEVRSLLDAQKAELREARIVCEGNVAITRQIVTADTLAAGLVA